VPQNDIPLYIDRAQKHPLFCWRANIQTFFGLFHSILVSLCLTQSVYASSVVNSTHNLDLAKPGRVTEVWDNIIDHDGLFSLCLEWDRTKLLLEV
jgi:hypothetical protein